ncbi:C-type lectin domain family 4 member M-like [Sardina pilchardus]|uniref:C-type lectin domain family 4 member M-like n=1 Tax=Sardina pilchardus TaxID=27697 RepID=UPI002E1394F5
MAEDNLVDVDSSEESRSYWDQGDKISASTIFNKMGIGRQSKKGFYKRATVCLGVLCVILLVVIISHKSHNNCKNDSTDGTFQQLTDDNNVTHNTVQSKTTYSNLNKQMDLLLTGHNMLIQEKSQLLARYNNLTDDRNLLQISYNNLISEKSQLNSNYSNLNREKSELQTRNAMLSDEKAQLQASYDNMTRGIDQSRTKLDSRLEDGWIARKPSVYKVSSEKKTWQQSRDSCLNMGADLMIVNDIEEQKFLLPYKNVWIGLSDTDNEGVWKWVDDTRLTTKFWAPGEPNNAGNEDCAEISSNAADPYKAWNDVPCSSSYQYICEDRF